MNLLVYVLNIFGSIHKKVVENNDFVDGNWVAGDEDFSLHILSCFLHFIQVTALLMFLKKRKEKENQI